MLNRLIDSFQEKFPPNRLCVILTPLVFVPAAAAVSGWLAAHVPGLGLGESEILGFALAGALSALTLAYKWLDQWQRTEGTSWSGEFPDEIPGEAEVVGTALAAAEEDVPPRDVRVVTETIESLRHKAKQVEEGSISNAVLMRDLESLADDLLGLA